MALSAFLAMTGTTALNLQAEAQDESLDDLFDGEGNFEIPLISDIVDANEAVNDAVEGIIDGVCYKDAYIAEPQFDPLVCQEGFTQVGIVCIEDCEGSWKDFGALCRKCKSGYKFKNGLCKKKRGWWTDIKVPKLKTRDV